MIMRYFSLFLAAVIFTSTSLLAERVVLKDGSVMEGKIVFQNAKQITLRKGKIASNIPREEIKEILQDNAKKDNYIPLKEEEVKGSKHFLGFTAGITSFALETKLDLDYPDGYYDDGGDLSQVKYLSTIVFYNLGFNYLYKGPGYLGFFTSVNYLFYSNAKAKIDITFKDPDSGATGSDSDSADAPDNYSINALDFSAMMTLNLGNFILGGGIYSIYLFPSELEGEENKDDSVYSINPILFFGYLFKTNSINILPYLSISLSAFTIGGNYVDSLEEEMNNMKKEEDITTKAHLDSGAATLGIIFNKSF